ncbi:MAG: hypothetical protein PHH59_16125 [Methylovulum sp.]|uniref:hypothetical protein n=2 Tax=Methylovulum sp. TaxID=1916980 RepID=UPI002629CEE5|nr:hypothetical protein [Methylovulum sp.]MDD2725534.1 hypothetical protein [Methylovulum sp.]
MNNQDINYQFEQLIKIGVSLSSEMNTDLLLEMILQGAMPIRNADGGTLYQIHGNAIKMEIVHSDSLGIKPSISTPICTTPSSSTKFTNAMPNNFWMLIKMMLTESEALIIAYPIVLKSVSIKFYQPHHLRKNHVVAAQFSYLK